MNTTTKQQFKYVIVTADVWGNEIDGFTVNDYLATGLSFHLDYLNTSEQEILKKIIKTGYFMSSASLQDLNITFEDEDNIYIDDKDNGQPICKLMRVGE
jgi:hypothetical protein